MGVIVRTADIATTVTVQNIWAGSAFEYARTNGLLSMGIVTPETAAAGPGAGLLCTINVGSDVVAEEFPLPTLDPAIVGRNAPLIPDDFYFQDAAAAGDLIKTQLRNPTGGTLAYYAVAIFTPTR
jgi:hypothetical protein